MSVRSVVRGPRAPIVRTRDGGERELIMGRPRQTAIERAGGVEPPRISVMVVDQLGVVCPSCGAPARQWCRDNADGRTYSNGRPVMCPARKDEAIRLSLAEAHELPR
jgi:hypothetical protein